MLAVDDEGTVLIADDGGKMVRMLSIQDNKLSTVLSGMHEPWQCSFNLDFTNYYVLERRTSMRPLLFYGLYKSSNWQEAEAYYDQKNDKGDYIAGAMDYFGLAADNDYVFLLSSSGKRLIRVSIATKKVELIGENLNMDSWAHIAYNKKKRISLYHFRSLRTPLSPESLSYSCRTFYSMDYTKRDRTYRWNR